MKHNDSCTDYLFKYQQEFYGHYAAMCQPIEGTKFEELYEP